MAQNFTSLLPPATAAAPVSISIKWHCHPGKWYPLPNHSPTAGSLPPIPSSQSDLLNHTNLLLIFPYCFPCVSVDKESACNAGDPDSIPGLGRSPGEGNGNPLQYSCLENPMDRGARRATVHGVTRVGQDLVTKPTPPQTLWRHLLLFTPNPLLHSKAMSCTAGPSQLL